VKLSHIEVTVPIGRTERGQTLTVMDLLKAFSVATGTEIGSQDFDRALSDPSQLHAKETIENAGRYRTLRGLAQNALESGAARFDCDDAVSLQSVSVEARQVAPGEWVKCITIELKNDLEEDLGLDQALSAINAGN
jgi:hypothetical protein